MAHEIGEHLKTDLLRRLGIEPEQTRAMMGESLANLFAHRLLVPTTWPRDDAPTATMTFWNSRSQHQCQP